MGTFGEFSPPCAQTSYLQDVELDDSIPVFIKSMKSPCKERKQTPLSVINSKIPIIFKNKKTKKKQQHAKQRHGGLTEHPLQPHEAADVTVKADVEALVRVAHGDDVVQLVVQVKACDGKGQQGRRIQRGSVFALHN